MSSVKQKLNIMADKTLKALNHYLRHNIVGDIYVLEEVSMYLFENRVRSEFFGDTFILST